MTQHTPGPWTVESYDKFADAKRECAHWKDSFERYGQHKMNCSARLWEVRTEGLRRAPCDCGFNAATRFAAAIKR